MYAIGKTVGISVSDVTDNGTEVVRVVVNEVERF